MPWSVQNRPNPLAVAIALWTFLAMCTGGMGVLALAAAIWLSQKRVQRDRARLNAAKEKP